MKNTMVSILHSPAFDLKSSIDLEPKKGTVNEATV